MLVTFVIGAAFFVAFIAMGYFGVREREREPDGAAPVADARLAPPGFCPLCDAPLRRTATREQVVFELEHRIAAELKDIAHLVRSAPDPRAHLQGARRGTGEKP